MARFLVVVYRAAWRIQLLRNRWGVGIVREQKSMFAVMEIYLCLRSSKARTCVILSYSIRGIASSC